MDPNNLQQQIDELKKRLDALQGVSTIPKKVDQSFEARGFSKLGVFSGKANIAAGGSARIAVPGATLKSVPMITYSTLNGSFIGEANIVTSLTSGLNYDLLIEGTATDVVWFIVFLNPKFIDYT